MEPLQLEKRTKPLWKPPKTREIPSNHVMECSSQKKTRDLPNLTECHACGFKFDVCTGKNGLRTLYSEWRVVLLCSKCFSSVESSRICTYCFSEASSDSFRCIQCRHSVHQNCFLKYRNAAPWSYSCIGSEFSVCVDCWIPKPVAISRSRRKVKGGVIKRKGRVIVEKVNSNSRVLRGGDLVRSMEDVVKDANHDMEKKDDAAAKAREEAVKKSVVARRAVEVANNALSLVPNREESGLKVDDVKFVDGSVMTSELHLNSSSKTSKRQCLLNTSCLDTPKIWDSSLDSSLKRLDSWDASGYEPSISVGSLDGGSSNDLNRRCIGTSDMKTCANDGGRTAEINAEEIEDEVLNEGEGSCSFRLISHGGEDSGLESDRKQADPALCGDERCNGKPDRYFLKYMRRRCRLKPNIESKPNNNKAYLESHDAAVGLRSNCSGELRTIYNASFRSYAPLQARICLQK
ncbi:hypothetical protein HN51_058051 [Arachis hypogaea]|uniref:Uncharacterized protein n=1 Tax=Arachis hypogaea TaxID=3818 RepID=A0A444WZC3_ARAHY|nr:uncharacterized protein LOC112786904 [Arachis hypogaea]XP_025686070.1 uncharacterized protein LOC112786904 [Arachis hypogaea]QHN81210.1 uncharacterized protein DS421_20g684880 [Arachis hypogaea]RYQ82740.1 hypothetical protein Ahy_B10g101308 [Arachis hypogaea]